MKDVPSQPEPPQLRRARRLTYCVIAFVAVLVLGYVFTPAHVHFRLFHDEGSFNSVLSEQPSSDVTLESTRALLGEGTPISGQRRQQLLKAIRDFCVQTPDSYPDGVDADDQFLGYDLGSHVSYLQFRDGKIVNFNPRDYDESFQFGGVN